MGILGILTCEILELEFAQLLANDPDLACITVVEDDQSKKFFNALEFGNAANLRRIKNLNEFTPNSTDKPEVLIRVLGIGLHNRKTKLQNGLIEATRELEPYVDALLLGYGLCGNALEKHDALLSDAGVPIFIPMDEDHPVDDCVGLLIGGRECYYREQCKVAGTFFMIPGWTHHWRRLVEQEFGNSDLDMLKRLFKNYERSLVILTSTMSEAEMKRNIETFNQLFGLRSEVRDGTLKILYEAWYSAKAFLNSQANTSQNF